MRIIREFVQGEPSLSIWPARADIKPALARLSKKLSVAESTVRERYGRLSRFLSGWTLMVNPGLVQEKLGGLSLEVPAAVPKKEVLEKLILVDDMLFIVNYSGRLLGCVFFYQDTASVRNKVGLIRRIAACDDAIYTDVPFPSCAIEPSTTDLRIILSRQEDMTKSNRMTAEELGVSSRTVKRRLARLVREGAVWPIASLREGALTDCVRADLLVVCHDAESRVETEAEIVPMVDDYLCFNGRFVSFTLFSLLLPSVPIAGTILDRVARMSGVDLARIDLVEERIESYGILAERVRRLLAQRVPS